MRLLPLFLTSLAVAAPIAPKKAEPQKPLTAAQKADFTKVIQPIFDAHCISCHGPKKEKGKLRLDTLEATLKGGKNPTFVMGKADSSMLLARVFLERTAGDVMPPKAEKPMTEKEKEAIYAFVEGQPIPDELSKAALADTKTAVAEAKNAPKPKK
ncbi:MAG: c-type cytochrome domain-containing protein [Verrucomicrobiota bacterium]|jgi:mono/diheme cytochrome c family protein